MQEIERLERCYRIAAKIVITFGDHYLPLFERVHKELKIAEAACDLKTLAMQFSKTESEVSI